MAFVAGHYTAKWGAGPTSIGESRDGFRLREIHHAEQIYTDAGGDAPVDGVQRGVEVLVTLDWVDYAAVKAAIHADHTQGLGMAGVGKLLSGLAEQLVLTPAIAGQGVFTFLAAIVEGDVEILLASRLRQGPLTFRCYPDPATGVVYTEVP